MARRKRTIVLDGKLRWTIIDDRNEGDCQSIAAHAAVMSRHLMLHLLSELNGVHESVSMLRTLKYRGNVNLHSSVKQ